PAGPRRDRPDADTGGHRAAAVRDDVRRRRLRAAAGPRGRRLPPLAEALGRPDRELRPGVGGVRLALRQRVRRRALAAAAVAAAAGRAVQPAGGGPVGGGGVRADDVRPEGGEPVAPGPSVRGRPRLPGGRRRDLLPRGGPRLSLPVPGPAG